MRKLLIFTLAFTVAAVLYIKLLSPTAGLILAAALAVLALAALLFRSDHGKRVRIAALGAAIGLFWTWAYEQTRILPMRELAGQEQSIQVQVCDFPAETDFGCSVIGKINGGKILLYLDCSPEEISLGDTLTLTADIIDVFQGSGDDNSLYYQSRDISLLALQSGEVQIKMTDKIPFSVYPAVAAQTLRETVTEIFPEDVEGFALALLTGERSGLSYEVQNELSITGVSHVVAVSGMHVSLIVGLILWLCRSRRRIAAFFCLLTMLFFAAMLGFTPSVTRAVIMNSVLLFAPLLKRENDSLTSLSLALLIILAFNPWAIANISLQLSFGAMVGIFLLTPYFFNLLVGFFQLDALRERGSRLAKPVYSLSVVLATTLGATVATTPFTVYAFGTVSLVSPVTNILNMAVISFIFSAAFVASILGMIWSPLGGAIGWILGWPIRYVLWVVDGLAEIPYAAVYTEKIYILAWVFAVYLLLAVYLWKRKSCRPTFFLSTLGVTLVAAVLFSGLETADLNATAMDVGQGQCIVVRSGGQTALVDCGGDSGDANGEDVARKLLMSGETRVDALILTHFDADHMCGVTQLMKRLDVAALYVPDIQREDETRAMVLKAAEEEGAKVIFVTLEMELPLGMGTVTLYPPVESNVENASLSALLSFEEYDILVTGDMTSDHERKLLRKYDLPDIEVLFAGHHGSKYSTCTELLEATLPETVVICVGENTYGHPSQEVLERIAAIGAEVYRTDLHGDITITR